MGSLWPINYQFWSNAKNQHRATAVPSSAHTVKKFSHPCGTGTVFRHDTETFENLVEAFAARQQDSGTYNTSLMERTESIQVAVEGLVFAVPFEIECNTIFYKIDLVPVHKVVKAGLGFYRSVVGVGFDGNDKIAMNSCLKPAHWAKQRGHTFGNLRFAATFGENVSRCQAKLNKSVLEVLTAEGLIEGFELVTGEGKAPAFKVGLKYFASGKPVISRAERFSKSGCRKYAAADKLPKINSGLGISIVSTSKGVMADHEARKLRVGGEVVALFA